MVASVTEADLTRQQALNNPVTRREGQHNMKWQLVNSSGTGDGWRIPGSTNQREFLGALDTAQERPANAKRFSQSNPRHLPEFNQLSRRIQIPEDRDVPSHTPPLMRQSVFQNRSPESPGQSSGRHLQKVCLGHRQEP